jgi:hypothetical protein
MNAVLGSSTASSAGPGRYWRDSTRLDLFPLIRIARPLGRNTWLKNRIPAFAVAHRRARIGPMRLVLVLAIATLVLTAVARAAVRLTGYGATRQAWRAHHQPDPNPKFIKGCCYLPRQADGRPRYYAVTRDDKGRVFNYSMHFAPKIGATQAKAILRRTELPADAMLVRSKRRAACLILQYRSAAAKWALGGATVGAALYSSDTGPYTGRVDEIIIGLALTTGAGC